MFRTRALLARAPLAVSLTAVTSMAASMTAAAAPSSPEQEATTDSYIVVFEDSVGTAAADAVAADHADQFGAEVTEVYTHALQGYSAELTADAASQLSTDDQVAYVERDGVAQISQTPQDTPTGVRRIFADDNPNLDIDGQDDARIDVDVAVIDTGVFDHPDLDVVARTDCSSLIGGCQDGSGTDDNGHGTHVAGSIAAIDNDSGVVGVAPGARIHSVKVCGAGGQCFNSSILAGIDYVAAHADTIEVANISLGGPGSSSSISQAVTAAVDAGVAFAVAAGNESEDAAGFFPANHPDVITVSALADADGEAGGSGGGPACRPQNADDTLADFSNFGESVEIVAPGVCILSTWNDGAYNTISGTSMAAPHVTGAIAILASGPLDPTNRADVLAIRDQVVAAGNLDWTDTSGDGVQEPLLDVGDAAAFPPADGGTPDPPDDPPPPEDPPANQPPTASFTAQCFGFFGLCMFDGTGSSDADGSIASWSWDFGDGTGGTGESGFHFYPAAGTYTVTLTVGDDQGASGSTTSPVNA